MQDAGEKIPSTGKLDSARSEAQTGCMHRLNLPCLTLCAAALLAESSGRAASSTVTVRVFAGEFDRQNVAVSSLHPGISNAPAVVVKRAGAVVPSQLGEGGLVHFVVEKLAAGASADFEIASASTSTAAAVQAGVKVERAGTTLAFRAGDVAANSRPWMAYQAEPGDFPRADIKPIFKRGGYLHPIATPSGKVVTDDFPPNHVHHHGVWWAWTSTVFDGRKPDFWNMGDGKGRVEFESVDRTWSGAVHGGFRARHRYVDLTSGQPVTVLNETWRVTAFAPKAGSRHWIFDLVTEHRCATDKELKLPEYRYGGVGLRGNWAWNGEGKALFLTSEGETDRVKGNTTRGRWCDMGGMLDGERVGIAILCHPDNFRAPQPMRLHPTEPFFNFAPQQAGDMAIKPGEKFVAQYRFVVHDGAPDKAELDRLWNDYANPPVVTVVGN